MVLNTRPCVGQRTMLNYLSSCLFGSRLRLVMEIKWDYNLPVFKLSLCKVNVQNLSAQGQAGCKFNINTNFNFCKIFKTQISHC